MGLKSFDKFRLPFLMVLVLCTSDLCAGSKYLQDFTPVRTFYVSPNGTGPGTSTSPMSLSAAILTSEAGDLYWLMGGTYSGMISFNRHGTQDRPVVFRAVPKAHVVINGGAQLAGEYNWLWGVEIVDPGSISSWGDGARLIARGTRLINNVIHQHIDKNGIGGWLHGPGQVIYGNIIYENGNAGAGIYMQNNFELDGYKYLVGNMFLDCLGSNCFHVHGFTAANAPVTGFFVKNNIFSNGRFLLGGYGIPSDRHVVKKNYFYDSLAQFGYRRPSQAKFIKNYLDRTTLSVSWFWGEGETLYVQKQPNAFTKNEIYRPPGGIHIAFVTSAYLGTGRCEGCPRIRPKDSFDNNKYSTPFIASFFADNNNTYPVNFQEWKGASGAAGNAMDGQSNEVGLPLKNKIVVIPNEYEPGRGHVGIYNWEGSSVVSVNLKSVAKSGQTIKVFDAKNSFGTPVFSGVYSGAVDLQVAGSEFKAFLVQVQ